MSERHACDVIGIARSTLRYQAVPAEDEVELTQLIRDYAHRYPQYGYRLITGITASRWNQRQSQA
jgi:putative transposase